MPAASFTLLFNFLQLFKEMPQEDIDVISEQLSFKGIDADTELLHEGNIAKEMFFICKGILKIVSINEKGNAVTQFFLKKTSFVQFSTASLIMFLHTKVLLLPVIAN